MREILKTIRDFILCCKKTVDVIEEVIDDDAKKKKIFKNYIWLIKKPKPNPVTKPL